MESELFIKIIKYIRKNKDRITIIGIYNEYKLINHPGNKHHVSNIFNINMKLIDIDIDGTKEKWYNKLLTENNIKFNTSIL